MKNEKTPERSGVFSFNEIRLRACEIALRAVKYACGI